MTGRTHNDIALRKTRGHDSNAAYVAHEGQKHLSASQLRRRDRIRQGLCPMCGKEVREEVKLGKVVVRGRVVRKCDDCLLNRAIWREEQAKKKEDPVGSQTLLGERLQRATEIETAKAHFDAKPKSTILVVGVRPTNLQREARGHDRVILWESGTTLGNNLPTVPVSVSVIMSTKFCSHQMSKYLREQAQLRQAFLFSGLLPTGDMRRHLGVLLNLDARKAHEDASDEVDGKPAPLPALPPMARNSSTLPKLPSIRPFAAASAVAEVPMLQTVSAAAEQAPEANIDAALGLIRDSMAALSLVAEQLEKTKLELVANAKKFEKFKALKGLLNELGD